MLSAESVMINCGLLRLIVPIKLCGIHLLQGERCEISCRPAFCAREKSKTN